MKKKIRVVKLKSLSIYWLFDMTDLNSMINSPIIALEKFEDLLNYRMNHKDEVWEFAEDFPGEEKLKLEGGD